MVANSHEKTKLQNEKARVGFGRTEVFVHHSKALRELFRMGMVSGVLVFKGSQIWAARSIRFQQFGPFWTVLDGFHRFRTVFERFRTVSDGFGLFSDRFGRFRIVFEHFLDRI